MYAVCRQLASARSPQLSLLLLDTIESLAIKCGSRELPLLEAISGQLTQPNPGIRRRAAVSLGRLGDPFPMQVIDFLDNVKPQENLFSNLQTLLRGGRDATIAASQAVQQVSQWWARITAEMPKSPPTIQAHSLGGIAAQD